MSNAKMDRQVQLSANLALPRAKAGGLQVNKSHSAPTALDQSTKGQRSKGQGKEM